MKKVFFLLALLLLTTLFIFTGSNLNGKEKGGTVSYDESDYKKLWREVRDHTSKGLPKSALKRVEKIYDIAKKKNNAGEFVKALIHKMRFIQYVEEDAFVKVQKELSSQLEESRFPITPLIHSMMAQQYWQYYLYNRYRILNRTTTVEFKQEDMRTWDLKKLVQETVKHYQKSLENPVKAKATRIDIYDSIIKKGSGRKYRPTLYDFLAHRAIDFYKDGESGLTQPVYRFTLNKAEYFSNSKDFAKMKITTRDPLSFKYYALTGLQELVRFHLKDKNPEALVDVELKRYRYLYKEAVLSNKVKVYEKALRRMIETYGGAPVTAEIYCELVKLYMALGKKYKPGKPGDYKDYNKKAHAMCLDTIKKYPGSFGARNCRHLLDRIEAKNLAITLDEAAVPGRPFPALINYKNIEKIYVRVVKTTWEEIEEKKKLYQNQMVTYYLGKKSLLRKEIQLPVDRDFQGHSTEIKIDALEPGEYIILVSYNKAFDYNKHAVVYSFFTASNIAYISRNGSKQQGKGVEIHVVNRETGRPMADVRAQLWYNEYDHTIKKSVRKKGPIFTTDEKGYFNIFKGQALENGNFYLEFIKNGDRLYTRQYFYPNDPYRNNSKQTKTFFFTDRSIYRPGQTVYFKGIMVKIDNNGGENTTLVTNKSTIVVFRDVNHRQEISRLKLKSNDYGTFSGTFQIPTGRLNGRMMLGNNCGYWDFSVEEYKRPKFDVKYPPMKETYRLGETVTIKGKAAAYAGYNIDKAEVKYRVVRRVFYPYRWCYWGYTPPSPQMEILNGVTKTDAKGQFEVTFKAIPDLTISKANQPAFTFTVHADVTDINGETRSGRKSVSIGYTALKISVDLPGKQDNPTDPYNSLSKSTTLSGNLIDKAAGPHTFYLKTTTLSGDFIPAKGELSIYRLKENRRLCRKKRWAAPDKFVIDKNDYIKSFPNDYYADEGNYRKWQTGKRAHHGSFDTGEAKELKLTALRKWKTGKYKIEMESKDRYGTPVKEIRYFTLYSTKEKKVPYKQLDWFAVPKDTVQPGEKAVLLLGTSAKNARVIYEIEYRGKIIKTQYLTLKNEQRKIEIPIDEKHRGNIGVHLIFIKYNRIYRHSKIINVPWTNKNLDISFETFRNKLKPGEKEEWRIKIKGKKGPKGETGEKAAAEMVATLYDASLDAFKTHGWRFSVYPYHRSTWYLWGGNNYFGTVGSTRIGRFPGGTGYLHKPYDRMSWFGFQGFHWIRRYVKPSRTWNVDGAGITDPSVRQETVVCGQATVIDTRKTTSRVNIAAHIGGDAGAVQQGAKDAPGGGDEAALAAVKARTNFQETAFFYPHLKTDKEGTIIIAFTVPEALTKWKMLGFAHTKDLKYGLTTNQLVTQKELMVVPNAPRFFREGDKLELTAKITNLTKETREGTAKLMLFDAATMQPVDEGFQNKSAVKTFKAPKGQSDRVTWSLSIPDELDAVTYRIVAASGKFSDGEEQAVPILSNRMLVTETLPLPVRAGKSKEYTFKKLVNSAGSTTIKHHKLTLEFTANPVWYAVQALPYLMEYPHECMEQTFSRYYANGIATHIVNSNPEIKRVFDIWKTAKDSNALLSNLEKNRELKSLLLHETPWVLNAKNETQRKKRIALLFDVNKMAAQLRRALKKLKEGQMPSGAWPWFKGMRESRYITQHIVCGLAHMHNLEVINAWRTKHIAEMIYDAVLYLDRQIKKDYQAKMHLGYIQIHYLYARSAFKKLPMDDGVRKAIEYYKKQAETYWMKFNKYMQGMIALSLNRFGNKKTAVDIIKSLKEHALHSEEMGMYWKCSYGYYWYQTPIETQAILIEAFDEVMNDRESVDEMRTWLLKQKQTQDWRTTKATAEACFALLLRGQDWTAETNPPDILLGKKNKIKIEPAKMDNVKVEAGTGYFKTSWTGKEIKPDMGYIYVKNNNEVAAWGGMYWQYFENLDKITSAKTPLHLKKKLFVEKPSDTGPVLFPLTKNTL
ncbi:MAG: hypothetical protein GY757_12155, partial [bacterium]|nr:hypothetical protein [bacterium]